MDGWLYRWEVNGWCTAKGNHVCHSDIWARILRCLRFFESSPTRRVEVAHVSTHVGVHDNERADTLAKQGAELRFKLMELEVSNGWFQNALGRYWGTGD